MNIAWTDKMNAYMLADTAVTRDGARPSGPTSLGQCEPEPQGGRFVHEAVLKVGRIGKSALLTGNGSSQAITLAAEALLRFAHAGADPADSLAKAGKEAARAVPGESFELLLVGHSTRDGSPLPPHHKLWESSNPNLVNGLSFGHVRGSAPGWLKAAVFRSLAVERGRRPPIDSLTEAQAFLFKSALQEPELLQRGVGGPFCGAYVGAEGVRWQEDTLFMVVTDEFLEVLRKSGVPAEKSGLCDYIATGIRDDVLVVHSSFVQREDKTEPGFRLFQGFGSPQQAVWLQRWGNAEILEIMLHPEKVVFLHRVRQTIAILTRTKTQRSPLRIVGPDLAFAFSRGLIEWLTKVLVRDTVSGGTEISWATTG